MKMNRIKMMKEKYMNHLHTMFRTTLYKLSLTLLLLIAGANGAWGQITPTTDPSNPVYYLFQSFGNTSFYMRPNNNNTNAAVSTSNILTDDMKWYFLESGESGYYYICDKDGNYLYFSKPSGSTSNRTYMVLKSLDNNDTEHYKFSIAKNNTKGWDAYNIIPYGNTDKYCLNKQGRNAGTNGVQVSNGWDDENSNWVIIPMTDYVWTLRADCFRPSDSSNKYFYQIKSKVDASYYIKPGTTYVETSNTVDDDMIWYFEEASSDNYMTYYYIRLANDGQYLKYRNNGDNAIQLANHTGSETGDAEDCFQFIVVRGAVSNEPWNTTDISYNIVPKLLKRTNNNINFYCVSSNKGLGMPLKIRNDRAGTDNKWTFVSVPFSTICANPTITFSNTTGKASITTTTTRSTIYYTTDGSEPSSSNGEVYTAPFEVTEQTTIKAFVTRTDFSDSQVTTKTIYKVATPSIQNTEASVISISTATSGATIYYTTDGSTPTTSSTQYTEPVTITASSVTIKAIAVKDGMINSAVRSESFAFACATPTISFDNTTNTVTITSETGSTIYYAYSSTDPADPIVDDDVAHGSSPVSFPISAKTYIKAIAVKGGLANSTMQSVTIDKVAAPTISFTGDNKVKLTCSTPGVTIYYEIGDDASSVTTPTTSSTRYTSPLSNVAGKVIKAIAVKDGWITSDIGGSEGPITLQCAMPIIRRGIGNTFTISCGFPAEGVHIYYTTGNDDPTTLYEGPVSIATYPVTVKAVARADGYNDSSLAEETITQDLAQDDGYYLIASAGDFEKFVTMANSTGAGEKYKVVDNFTVSGNTAVSTTFTGTFEGGFDDESGEYFTITGLRQPLFNSTNNAIIKNVILDNVIISSGTNVSAICGEATGDTRIYNCGVLSGSIGGSDNVGGIVGLLDGSSRVINCYNYANITSGSNCGGIVGYNNVASTSSNLQTMVMNCMFYGNIEGDNAAPIYGGNIIHNKYASDDDTGLNNYCYFLYDEEKNPYVKSIVEANYHGALGAEERFLNRFEFFRMTLNSTRNVAAYYVTGDATQKGEIAKWVLDKSIAPYPILKVQDKYPSIVNPDAEHATTQTERNKGGLLGTLSVTINGTGGGAVFSAPTGAHIVDENGNEVSSRTLTLNITDKDFENYNFNYKKIQLPYYNEVGTGNYTGGRVVTGWKITSITGGTPGSFTTNTYDYPSFNFVDRKCTNKDLYGTDGSNRVFAQGAYWEVPDDVTAITIEPYWAKAVYLSDANYDMTYTITISGTGSSATATANKYGVSVCGTCPTTYNGQTVYTDLSTAITNLASNANDKVYDYAVVLVGNYHQAHNNALVNNGKPITFMSADLDGDNEPDNTLFYYHNQRKVVSPIRFDFLNIPGIGMVKRTHDATMDPEPGILAPQGWFEITNTVFIRFGQFEYAGSNSATKTILAPLILQGGIYEQFVSCCRTNAQNTNYLLIGGNAWFLNFANGCHTAQANKTPKVPINVTGGDYTNFYLTGIYQPASNEDAGNAECYIDGGRFTEVAGSGMQQIKGDVTWLINAADITSFYGGGINAAKPITGSISTTISNSYVDEFYGGPKFGDMDENKTVTTNATDCHFGKYFGAGYGGTAFNKVIPSPTSTYDSSSSTNTRDWNKWVDDQYKRAYSADNGGISTSYDYEFILHSDGNQTVARFYVNYASLSLATTRNVTSTLSGCTIGTFYGGGSLGAVNGDVNSTLTNCTVTGNAFGAGFSASVPTVEVWNANAYLNPKPTYNRTANVFNNASVKTPKDNGQYVEYTWSKTHGSNASPFTVTEDGKHYIHTDVSLEGLGAVTGNVTLNILGDQTLIEGDVYGGGAESNSNTDYYKTSPTTDDLATKTTVNVFGGTIRGDVYGSGLGRLAKDAIGTPGAEGYTPAVTAVAANVGNVKVNLNGIDATDYKDDYTTLVPNGSGSDAPYVVKDDAKGCVVKGNIFGCNNLNGTPKGTVTVHVYATQNEMAQRITNPAEGAQTAKVQGRWDVKAVYGGGNLAAYEPTELTNGKTQVIIDGCDRTSIQQVYGGGNAASTPATDVTINGTFEIEEVFGGGNGKDNITVNGVLTDNPGANVGFYAYEENIADKTDTPENRASYYGYGSGKAQVNIFGGLIHRVYGGSNTKGNVRQIAVAMLEDEELCSFHVDEAYGGGKSANMDGEARLEMHCIPGLNAAYGGAENADINNAVTLNITNGKFGQVFGGNNRGGRINGPITVNIEETGCRPIIIGELYGGGNRAAYSIYGYTPELGDNNNPLIDPDGKYRWLPLKQGDTGALASPYASPVVNVKSFTSIGDIYGGGYGETAVMVGDPTLNINVVTGDRTDHAEAQIDTEGTIELREDNVSGEAPVTRHVTYPTHKQGEIGAINNVFGGGNAAKVIGSTYVNVATVSSVDYVTKASTGITPVKADIRGNVFGGGNEAKVTGDTHVRIGQKIE